MTDRKKVVRAVETCFDSWIDRHRNMGLDVNEVERMKLDALDLLKEQEPVKPAPGMLCGQCGCQIYRDANYCYNCGRRVAWDD